MRCGPLQVSRNKLLFAQTSKRAPAVPPIHFTGGGANVLSDLHPLGHLSPPAALNWSTGFT